jgi:hypothetical protein
MLPLGACAADIAAKPNRKKTIAMSLRMKILR